MLNSGEKTPCWLALEGVIQRMRPLTTVGPRAGCRKLAASHKFFCPCTFLPPLRARSCLQAHKLERVRCFWDRLYQMHGWTREELCRNVSDSPRACWERLLQPVSALAGATRHPPAWSGGQCSSGSPCPLCLGDPFGISPRATPEFSN